MGLSGNSQTEWEHSGLEYRSFIFRIWASGARLKYAQASCERNDDIIQSSVTTTGTMVRYVAVLRDRGHERTVRVRAR